MNIDVGISLGAVSLLNTAGPKPFPRVANLLEGRSFVIRLIDFPASPPTALALLSMEFEGQPLTQTSEPFGLNDPWESVELAKSPNPGQINRYGGQPVSAVSAPLEVGAKYLLTYEIADNAVGGKLYAGTNCPFAFQQLPSDLGYHALLLTAQDLDTEAIMRVVGDFTFGHVSLKKAQWSFDVPTQQLGSELASNVAPGRIDASEGQQVAAVLAPLVVGDDYVLTYRVTAVGPGTQTLVFDEGSPFSGALSADIGLHEIILTAESTQIDTVMRVFGDVTFDFLSLRRRAPSAERAVSWSMRAANSSTIGRTIYLPKSGEIHVSPGGSDAIGTGAAQSAFLSIQHAVNQAQPGDTVYVHPGIYAPFSVKKSGTNGKPITVTTPLGQERLAVIDGTRGSLLDTTKHGIYVKGQNYIEIENLTIQDCYSSGVRLEGNNDGQTYGHHRVAHCKIQRVGDAGVFAMGYLPSEHLPIGTVWLSDVIIEYNDITQTNLILPHNPAGGVNECISVAGGIRNVITRFNNIHDSRQYGIDYKHGFVGGGEIYGNKIWNMAAHGIYVDTNRLECHDIAIYGNLIWQCYNGIVLAREGRPNDSPELKLQSLRDIDVYNNVVWDCAVTCFYIGRHPNDEAVGDITNIRVRFNTFVNGGRSGFGYEAELTGWSSQDFQNAGIVTNVDFIGNVMYRNSVQHGQFRNLFFGQPGFTVAQNYFATDPLFVDPDVVMTDLFATLPDFRLQAGSPAAGLADAPYFEAPFDHDLAGNMRVASANAGAY